MRFCQRHWDALRHAIQARGLGDFIAGSGQEAVEMATRALKGGQPKKKSDYDPLLSAHWMIVNNTMEKLKELGFNPMGVFAEHEEHPECQCPLCYLNFLSLEHDRTCDKPDCPKPKGMTFDNWIDKAADGAAGYMASLPQ